MSVGLTVAVLQQPACLLINDFLFSCSSSSRQQQQHLPWSQQQQRGEQAGDDAAVSRGAAAAAAAYSEPLQRITPLTAVPIVYTDLRSQ